MTPWDETYRPQDLSHYLSATERATKIIDQWGFQCACALCSASPQAVKASDRRLNRIKTLETALDDISDGRLASSSSAEKLIALYEEERLHANIAIAYRYAAYEYSYEGNMTMAKKYAALAKEGYEVWQGNKSRTAGDMAFLFEETHVHPTWKRFNFNKGADSQVRGIMPEDSFSTADFGHMDF